MMGEVPYLNMFNVDTEAVQELPSASLEVI
uniref:Uncharacterized protein n=1 Tax=Rhizophora mucronata TaxID=61149 RepID=A0A2P2NQA1_RHIMU